MLCETPSHAPGGPSPVSHGFEVTECEPFSLTSSSSAGASSPTFRTALSAKSAATKAFVRVPKVSNPSTLAGYFTIDLTTPFPQLSLTALGWQILLLPSPAPASAAQVVPPTLPTESVDQNDRVLSAEVILPEGGGFQQYFVPVTQRYEWLGYYIAQLQTPQWTVFLLRNPV